MKKVFTAFFAVTAIAGLILAGANAGPFEVQIQTSPAGAILFGLSLLAIAKINKKRKG